MLLWYTATFTCFTIRREKSLRKIRRLNVGKNCDTVQRWGNFEWYFFWCGKFQARMQLWWRGIPQQILSYDRALVVNKHRAEVFPKRKDKNRRHPVERTLTPVQKVQSKKDFHLRPCSVRSGLEAGQTTQNGMDYYNEARRAIENQNRETFDTPVLESKPPNYLWLALFTTVFCNPLTGIVAMVMASK